MKILATSAKRPPRAELTVLPISQGKLKIRSPWKGLTASISNAISKEIGRRGFKASSLHTTAISLGEKESQHFLVVGTLDSSSSDRYEQSTFLRRLGATIQAHARHMKCNSVLLHASGLALEKSDNLSTLVEGFRLSSYSFLRYKSKSREKSNSSSRLILWPLRASVTPAERKSQALASGISLARDLINTPARDCTPRDLVKAARSISRSKNMSIQIYDRTKLSRMGARALLAVSQGSSEPPFLIRLRLKPPRKSRRIISLVGKGVTFDSGGLSIKTAHGMETMKYDMSGAAAVLGAMAALAQLRPSVEVRAYIPTTENMINGHAVHPGDVVRAMNGKSIEILNTDAEGRLILADALCLAHKEKSDTIVDIATLTGACRIALGLEYAALFSNSDVLVKLLSEAAEEAGERMWRMPLASEYRSLLKSPIADLKNTGGSYGGAITAALFLQEFVPNSSWAHIDIAGPAYSDTDRGYIKKGGVGFGVGTLVHFVLSQTK